MRKEKKQKKKSSLKKIFIIFLVIFSPLILYFFLRVPPLQREEPRQVVRLPMPKPKAIPKVRPPLLSIIIDDGGYNLENIKKILALGRPLTFAILPEAPYSRETALLVHQKGNQVLLHLPMEPKEGNNSPVEKNMIRCGMPPPEIKKFVQDALKQIPEARGINNHMGSKATEDPQVMEVLKKEKMFYIDSNTSLGTVGPTLAGQKGVPFARNERFIDREKNVIAIKQAIRQAIKKAQKEGRVVIIGHPFPETKEAIAEMIPEIERQGIRLVFASEVVG